MKIEEPRRWSWSLAPCHSPWEFDSAKRFVEIAHEAGIEPIEVFPGSRQIHMRCYEFVTPELEVNIKRGIFLHKLTKVISKVWSYKSNLYLDYSDDFIRAADPKRKDLYHHQDTKVIFKGGDLDGEYTRDQVILLNWHSILEEDEKSFLNDQPIFDKYIGPMFDGGTIIYEA